MTSLAIVGVLLVLRTPIADPDRISVADQVRRLETGRVSPQQFDFTFLRFGAGRFGMEALQRLTATDTGPDAAAIKERAADALLAASPLDVKQTAPRLTPEQRAGNIAVVQPSGAALPERFLQQDWKTFRRQWLLPRCLVAAAEKCEAVLVDLDGDGQPEILLFNLQGAAAAAAFKADGDQKWRFLGTIANGTCPGVREALKTGQFETVPPLFKEIEVNGQRLHVTTD